MKRNRKERRSATVYKLSHIFDGGEADTLMVDDQEHYIEGELAGRVIISVPEQTSLAMVDKIQKAATVALKQPVLIVTHNVEFMRVEKLPANKAADVIGRVERGIESEKQAAQEAQDNEIQAQEDIANLRRELLAESGQAIDGPGGGSGDCEHGGSGTPVESEGGDQGGAGADGEDAESDQEASDSPTSSD